MRRGDQIKITVAKLKADTYPCSFCRLLFFQGSVPGGAILSQWTATTLPFFTTPRFLKEPRRKEGYCTAILSVDDSMISALRWENSKISRTEIASSNFARKRRHVDSTTMMVVWRTGDDSHNRDGWV
jgi:hypothetical protein